MSWARPSQLGSNTAFRSKSSSTNLPISRFEPAGFTKNPDIPIAKSVADYIFRWLGMDSFRATAKPTRPSAPLPSRKWSPEQSQPPMLKINGLRTATLADLEHAEAVMGAASSATPSGNHVSSIAEAPEGLVEQTGQLAHSSPMPLLR